MERMNPSPRSGFRLKSGVGLPPLESFRATCERGLSAVRPLKHRLDDPAGWNFGQAVPPSYPAFGRFRFLTTLELARPLAPGRVLEVAANDGSLSACLASLGSEVVANDLRTDRLKRALSNYDAKVEVVDGDLFALTPDGLGTFDLVVACEVIEHVAHPDALLRHLATFLRPAGRLLLTTPNGAYHRNRLPTLAGVNDFAALEPHQFLPDADGHLFLLTPEELSGLADQAGLSVVQLSIWGGALLTGHHAFRRLASRPMIDLAYRGEQLLQALPWRARRRVGASLAAVFAAPRSARTQGSG